MSRARQALSEMLLVELNHEAATYHERYDALRNAIQKLCDEYDDIKMTSVALRKRLATILAQQQAIDVLALPAKTETER